MASVGSITTGEGFTLRDGKVHRIHAFSAIIADGAPCKCIHCGCEWRGYAADYPSCVLFEERANG